MLVDRQIGQLVLVPVLVLDFPSLFEDEDDDDDDEEDSQTDNV